MRSRIELFRLALLETASAADLSDVDPELAGLCGWLLPLIKTFGAELAFDTASRSIQLLDGAGYTRDYPVEQMLRDSRVYAIYEGTTGMQAQDFLLRKSLKEQGAAVHTFLRIARSECSAHTVQLDIIAAFDSFFRRVRQLDEQQGRASLAGMADGFMRAGWIAVQAWLSVRITGSESTRFFLASAMEKFRLYEAEAVIRID